MPRPISIIEVKTNLPISCCFTAVTKNIPSDLICLFLNSRSPNKFSQCRVILLLRRKYAFLRGFQHILILIGAHSVDSICRSQIIQSRGCHFNCCVGNIPSDIGSNALFVRTRPVLVLEVLTNLSICYCGKHSLQPAFQLKRHKAHFISRDK